MHHLSRALASARIDDRLRDAAQMHMIRLARRVTREARVAANNVADNRRPRVNSGRYAWSRTSTELARRRR